jgi:hypothetical protein
MAVFVAPVSAERLAATVDHGGECPYEHARLAAARSDVSDDAAGGSAWTGFGRASIFAP